MLSTLAANSDFNIDANSILMDLDKSLRSTLIGDQCEAIVRFPWLFQRYPFPILINSASLKLAEVFRTGSNFLRILILQVMKESEKHLDKILNVDEFVRLLFGVSYSNDPLARSITLRTLGHIARIASQNKSIYHFIRNSLDSNDELEVEAAIEASVRYAIESKDFGEIIYPKIISMIEGLTTSMKTKIRLLEVINNLHHNFIIAEDAREKLIGFLAKYPGQRFVCENLHTLTSISASSVTKISDQVKLLLEYYQIDPRSSIKFSVLKDLGLLAHESAHLWEKSSIKEFVHIVFPNFNQENTYFAQIILDSNTKELRLLCQALGVLSELLSSPSIFINDSLFSVNDIFTIINFCTQIIHQSSTQSASKSNKVQILLVSKCFTILTNICLYINPEFYQKIIDENVMSKTSCAYEAYFFSKFNSNMKDNESKRALQLIFHCAVILCRAKETNSRQITEALRFIFLNSKPKCSWYEMICDSICSLASIIRDNKSLTATDILDVMKSRYCHSKNKAFQENESATIKIFIIYFQLKNGQVISQSEKNCLLSILDETNLWICYKIVREAMRFGHHSFASLLLFKFKNCMEPIENTYFWINSLERIAKAESYLSQVDFCSFKGNEFLTAKYDDSKFEQNLSIAISTYTQGFTHLKASVSSSNPMKFKCGFVKLRMKYLQAHQHFRQCCKLLQSSPPPISTIGSSTDDFLKCGRIGFSMRKCANEFRSIADGYSSLYQSSFNADPNSLSNIQLLQHSCTILAEVIENLFESSHRKHSLFVPSRTDMTDNITDMNSSSTYSEYNNMNIMSNKHYTIVEHRELEDICMLVSELVRTDQLLSLSNINAKQSSDNSHFLTVFTKQIDMLIRISTRILAVPLSFPRFYFQKIQSINIKLELSPQPRNNQEYILVNLSSQFVLNVEGVVNSNSELQRPFQSPNLNSLRFGSGYSASSLPSLSDLSLINRNLSNESKLIRRVNKILLNLNVVQTSTNSASDINSYLSTAPIISMHSVVTPLNDYFQTQFLLTFSNVGIYNITVETSIIDENDAQWKTGPIQSTIAKVIEDYKPL